MFQTKLELIRNTWRSISQIIRFLCNTSVRWLSSCKSQRPEFLRGQKANSKGMIMSQNGTYTSLPAYKMLTSSFNSDPYVIYAFMHRWAPGNTTCGVVKWKNQHFCRWTWEKRVMQCLPPFPSVHCYAFMRWYCHVPSWFSKSKCLEQILQFTSLFLEL